MPPFDFIAVRQKHEFRGRVVAPDLLAARRHLTKNYDRVLSVEPVAEEKEEFLPLPWRRVGVGALAAYTRQFATLLQAGVTLHRSLVILERGDSPLMNKVLATVRHDVTGGMPLSAALARQGNVFPPDYVALVRAGETGGTLADTLRRLADGLEKAAHFKQKLTSALTYPASVLALAAGVLWLFLYWVMPAMTPLFENLGVEMPLLTRLVVQVTALLSNPWLVVGGTFVLFVGVSFGYNFLFKTPEGRKLWWGTLHRTPILGDALGKLAMSRFLFALSAMLGSGVRFEQALLAVEDISPDPVLQQAIASVRDRIRVGLRVVEAMEFEPVFPRMVVQMVMAGESSGHLAQMMQRTAEAFDLELDLFMSGLLALMEPLVLAIMGVVASVVLLAAFLPILQLMTAF